MAYSNWGAFVYKDGIRRNDREDVAVFNDDEKDFPQAMRIFMNISKRRAESGETKESWAEHSHHAVLGDGRVRLCGYKDRPELWKIWGSKFVNIQILPDRFWDEYDSEEKELAKEGIVKIGKKEWCWKFKMYNLNMVDLWLEEPGGSKWNSTCGYCYGAGHMDEEENNE